jgi:hypothetical protein
MLLLFEQETEAEDDAGVKLDRAIVCRGCGHAITHRKERVEIDGKHHHTFVNPSALVFDIGCFRYAPGCAGYGAESSYWSWFPGYAWRMASCAKCTEHLGWSFKGRERTFFGLILDKLVD